MFSLVLDNTSRKWDGPHHKKMHRGVTEGFTLVSKTLFLTVYTYGMKGVPIALNTFLLKMLRNIF